jgi:hypothetical protein
VKQILDPPSTGIHIVSSLNGTTRAWENIESGFDLNNIASWSIETIERVYGGAGSPKRWKVEFIPDGKNIRRSRVLAPSIKEEYDHELAKKSPLLMTQKEFEKWRRQNPRS